jgi:hypothetical protein
VFEENSMKRMIVCSASVFIVSVVLVAQSQDRFTLKAANGIAFSEFRGYDAWQMIATSQPDDAGGCGTSKIGCTKAILGNPAMLTAYREGIPGNGQAVPDGAAIAKVEWLKDRKASPLWSDGARDANRGVIHGEGFEALSGDQRMGLRHVHVRRIV